MRVLLVEDDDRVVAALVPALQRAHLKVRRVATAAEAVLVHAESDLVLLDMGLPDQDGLALCRQIREVSQVPIIAVTARREEASLVSALRAGVDDYVVKPYSLAVLMARIDAVMRRFGQSPVAPVSELGDLRLDHACFEAFLGEQALCLARKEFELLSMLVQARGEAVTRESLMEGIWDTSWVGASRTLDVHVSSLRSKLGRPGLIQTVRGVGYRIAVS
ncbi:response regulator transcription factor [Nocardioides mesophilus]|uniref:Response regulator transcription factor n=1 Tax=Nocardioides mesophilus TaxID=433659 RepID=A0A7G9R9M2_9ACTN|nr:response regulator transcription factor [Nocardioides mesophilus]QNN52297.1 response regulator transcription factor [Nocardioides mesophilus]